MTHDHVDLTLLDQTFSQGENAKMTNAILNSIQKGLLVSMPSKSVDEHDP